MFVPKKSIVMNFQRGRRVLRLLSLAVLLGAFMAPLGGGASSGADKLHVIFAIATNEPEPFAGMVETDLKLMDDEIELIAFHTGLSLNKKVFKGKDFTQPIVAGALRNLSAGPNDVILFYYSGHGFRTKKKRSKWSYHHFPDNKPMDFAWVIQTLKGKGARLTIALTDACNNVVNIKVKQDQSMRIMAKSNLARGYKTLFLESKGHVSAPSSIPGEVSTATASGSLFTLSFLKALKNEVVKAAPSWKSLMAEGAGKRLFFRNKYKHTPYYEMNVARVRTQSSPPPARTSAPPPARTSAPPPTRTPAPPPTRTSAPPPTRTPAPPSSGGWRAIQ